MRYVFRKADHNGNGALIMLLLVLLGLAIGGYLLVDKYYKPASAATTPTPVSTPDASQKPAESAMNPDDESSDDGENTPAPTNEASPAPVADASPAATPEDKTPTPQDKKTLVDKTPAPASPAEIRLPATFPKDLSAKVYVNSIGMYFVWIPAGKVEREDNRPDELKDFPTVEIKKDLLFGMMEITQKQWKAVMGNNPSEYKEGSKGAPDDTSDYPVGNISWNMGKAFCEKLTKMETEAGKISGKYYRLPTADEWEYACRGGKSKNIHHFGNDSKLLPEYCWYGENSDDHPHPVAQKKPNDFGLYDMHGNVWEWTSSTLPVNDSYYIVCGCSWVSRVKNLTCSRRDSFGPDEFANTGGLRVILDTKDEADDKAKKDDKKEEKEKTVEEE